MDPNKTLRELRNAVASFQAAQEADAHVAMEDAGERMASAVETLDTWL